MRRGEGEVALCYGGFCTRGDVGFGGVPISFSILTTGHIIKVIPPHISYISSLIYGLFTPEERRKA